jgi:hypothetical protein
LGKGEGEGGRDVSVAPFKEPRRTGVLRETQPGSASAAEAVVGAAREAALLVDLAIRRARANPFVGEGVKESICGPLEEAKEEILLIGRAKTTSASRSRKATGKPTDTDKGTGEASRRAKSGDGNKSRQQSAGSAMHRTIVDGRYELLGLLVRGGMGEVYLARDEILGREVALKVLERHHAASGEFFERFRREARRAASFSHPNVVEVFDAGEDEDGTPYIAMEYLSGGTLAERLAREDRLEPEEAVGIALRMAAALGEVHQRGLIHRDIKPENASRPQKGR